MKSIDLEAIQRRAQKTRVGCWTLQDGSEAVEDQDVLLDEVERLRAENQALRQTVLKNLLALLEKQTP